MPYINNLQSLADIVSPATASFQAGLQSAQENQAQQLANQKMATMMPLEAQQMQLGNQMKQAMLPGLMGQSASQLAAGQTALQTQASNAQSILAKNISSMTGDQAQTLTNVGQILNQTGAALQNVPPAARPAMLNAIGQKYGVDLSQQYPQLMQMDPNQLPAALSQIGQSMVGASTAWQQFQMQQNTQKDIANTNAASRLGAATIAANASMANAKTAAQARELLMNTMQFQAKLEAKVAAGTATPAEVQELNQLRILNAMHSTNPYMGSLLFGPQAGQIPSQVIPQVPTNGGAPAGTGAGGQIQGGGGGQSIEAAANAAWGSKDTPGYQPDKYMYRIGPDGKIQRKAKK